MIYKSTLKYQKLQKHLKYSESRLMESLVNFINRLIGSLLKVPFTKTYLIKDMGYCYHSVNSDHF
jgi:hypothetical protein